MRRRGTKALPTAALAVVGSLVAEPPRKWPAHIVLLGVRLDREELQDDPSYSNDRLDESLPLRIRAWYSAEGERERAYSVTIELGPWNAPRAAYFHASAESFEAAGREAATRLGNTLRLLHAYAGPVRSVLSYAGASS